MQSNGLENAANKERAGELDLVNEKQVQLKRRYSKRPNHTLYVSSETERTARDLLKK